jgi:nucleoside phosphorylase
VQKFATRTKKIKRAHSTLHRPYVKGVFNIGGGLKCSLHFGSVVEATNWIDKDIEEMFNITVD